MKLPQRRKLSVIVNKGHQSLFTMLTVVICSLLAGGAPASGQAVLFDFDNAPLYTPLPITQNAGGVTANFTATGQGFSIQDANVLGFTQAGFSGHIIYPNSVYQSDLLISFDQPLTDFSIMYTCQELGCDDAATMRVTAYMNGNLVGTNTKTASIPGTWPVDTLSCSFAQGFNSVVVHYDSPPPTCQDYGVIFMADNMRATAVNVSVLNPELYLKTLVVPNPVSHSASMLISLFQNESITIVVHDGTGRKVTMLFNGMLTAGMHELIWDLNDDAIKAGLYFLRISGKHFSKTTKIVVVK